MSDAWFDHHMPDLNQKDEHLAAYLIQNSIWWIEYSGIDAFRIDTYAYPDQLFMKQLNESIRKEYPNFFIFGETWVQGTPVQAWFTEKNGLNKSYSSEMQGVTDFQLYFAMMKGLNEPFGWEEGLRRIELILGHDYQYADARNNVTHLDNHDLTRFYTSVGEDYSKWKIGIGMLLTLRGIPQIYYGTEILMKNAADPDAKVREDFPGGWPHDSVNKFNDTERNPKEQEAYTYISRILKWRNTHNWFGDARTTQFVPENNTYVYFRHNEQHSVMVIVNLNDANFDLDLNRFEECLKGQKEGFNISTQEKTRLEQKLTLAPKSIQIIELR
jgi:glycosidase